LPSLEGSFFDPSDWGREEWRKIKHTMITAAAAKAASNSEHNVVMNAAKAANAAGK